LILASSALAIYAAPANVAGGQPIDIPDDLPIHAAGLMGDHPLRPYGRGFPGTIRNRLSIDQIRAAVRQRGDQIVADLSQVARTLDGQRLDPHRIYGSVVCGPYPFEAAEAAFAYPRFRRERPIDSGIGHVDVGYFLSETTNSENWTDSGQVAIRLKLFHEQSGQDLDLGVYDTFCMFRQVGSGKFELLPSIVEGPMVNLVTSDWVDRCVISLVTSRPVVARVTLDDGRYFHSAVRTTRHEIPLTDLRPNQEYTYRVTVGEHTTRPYRLRTAPPPGATGFRFAYGGDSREGAGFGLESHMGCNYLDLHRLASLAYHQDCRFLLQGGDLVNGYTTRPEDYRTQLYGWKHAMMGFLHERPAYPAMGNHECLIYNFDDGSKYGINVDMWPYDSTSSEAIFAQELVLPTNGPRPSNPARPSYRENVYSFQYGCVLCIAVNNNYWISFAADRYGGSPEGYILRDQVDWIKAELDRARDNPTVKYVLVYMQEPMLPNGGHIQDAMWYLGNNNQRAHTWDGTKLVPAGRGIIEVRNELLRALHENPKVVAVLGSDEHGYSKTLIDCNVPLGEPHQDDRNRDGWINFHGQDTTGDGNRDATETASPLHDLRFPVWHLVGGGFGAPFYARQRTPWNQYWTDDQDDDGTFFYYSSQPNVLIFDVTDDGISVTVYNHHGEVIDRIANLAAFGKRRPDAPPNACPPSPPPIDPSSANKSTARGWLGSSREGRDSPLRQLDEIHGFRPNGESGCVGAGSQYLDSADDRFPLTGCQRDCQGPLRG
jgi:hypothetical protein